MWAALINYIKKMIVSNLLKFRNALVYAKSPTKSLLRVSSVSQNRLFNTKLSADDTMENIDDIFKQMERVDLAKQVVEDELSELLEPRIVSQKEDIIYVKNPPREWAFNHVLNIGGGQASAITLCLQEQQAIALLTQ